MARTNNNITLEIGKPQKGKIKVHTEIINDLSSGIYSSPASCIKELVNNSYDAEARLVTIRIKPIQDSITVMDDGNGMNAEDFDLNFAWISKSNKRNDGEVSSKLKRPLIGKIGIGFIAVNEMCDELEITSTKKGEAFKFTANINFKKYFHEAIKEETSEANNNAGIIKAEYNLINEDEDRNEHYTIIKLVGLKDGVRRILDGQLHYVKLLEQKNKKNYSKSYFKSMTDLLQHHYDKGLRSYSDDNEYVKFIIDLSSYIPVEYVDKGPVEGIRNQTVAEIVKYHNDLNFKVDLDGIFLKKPILFQHKNDTLAKVESFKDIIIIEDPETGSKEEIRFKGYFYAQNKILYPREVNGLSVRIRAIPIAPRYGYDTTFMQFPTYLQQLFMNWISGEVYVEKGLEDAMNIDRASFRLTHPHYLALQDYIHKHIHSKVLPLVYTLYDQGKDIREKQKEKSKKQERKKILHSSKYELVTTNEDKKEISDEPVQIKKSAGKTVVEIDKSYIKRFKKKDWEYLEDIFLIFETAFKESHGNTSKLKKLFYQKINEWKGS